MLEYAHYNGDASGREAAPEPVPQRPASLAAIISRIEQAVDEETAADPHRHELRPEDVERAQEPLSLRADPGRQRRRRGRLVAEQRERSCGCARSWPGTRPRSAPTSPPSTRWPA